MNTVSTTVNECGLIEIAGDICLDVAGVPIAPRVMMGHKDDNWRQTGETRTHYLHGGSLLLQHWVQAAAPRHNVRGPRPCLPSALACGDTTAKPLNMDEFLRIAERLTRNEVVHSLLELASFPATPGSKERDQLRVLATHGFSGPKDGDPSLIILPAEGPAAETAEGADSPKVIVIDDTGNQFRRTTSQWPVSLSSEQTVKDSVLVYKLHRPLPAPQLQSGADVSIGTTALPASLWQEVAQRFPERRIVVVSIDDMRDKDAVISKGLSWERTSLDVVWHLLNAEVFAELRDCPHLIVRFGLNGALYWRRSQAVSKRGPQYNAWLIYDPAGIEGVGESEHEGRMAGYGSAFTAALTGCVANSTCISLVPEDSSTGQPMLAACIESGIKAGLLATRRLLRLGFGNNAERTPSYPGKELFDPPAKGDPFFACQPVPIIPGATVPDRGYWRLLDSIFEGKTALLHTAVALTAISAEPTAICAEPVTPEEVQAVNLLKQVPIAVFAEELRTHDRREIENYRALYSLMRDYISQSTPPRPLSMAVFGPPGAGKSFGVKMVAKALSQLGGPRPIETVTFNLSQYESPEQLADAFHLVRDLVLRGKTPLVFFDEFDSSLAGVRLGWLRYFLAPMQDAEFLDNGTPHPIGKAIFVFAGGTSASYAEFAAPFLSLPSDDEARKSKDAFKGAKGPDFLSRLRGTLDIPGLDLNMPFDPYGPVDALPCEAAILLRRAGILAHQLGKKAPQLRNSANAMRVSAVVLRALLHLPKFAHGNRSFEALLDMSSLTGSEKFTPSLLPSPSHAELHADSVQLGQLLSTEYPFTPEVREIIAKAIHESYVSDRTSEPKHDPNDPSLKPWDSPTGNPEDGLSAELKESNRLQADHLAVKLRMAGLWFRKKTPGVTVSTNISQLEATVERLAIAEHDRWVAEKRRNGWIPAPCQERECRNNELRLHNCLFRWDQLTEEQKKLDLDTVRRIPDHLDKADCEIVNL